MLFLFESQVRYKITYEINARLSSMALKKSLDILNWFDLFIQVTRYQAPRRNATMVTLTQVITIAIVCPILVQIAIYLLNRYSTLLGKLELHLSPRIGISFNEKGHTLATYGTIRSLYARSFVKRITATVVHIQTKDTHLFELDTIGLSQQAPFAPPVAFSVSPQQDFILLATFKDSESYEELRKHRSEWYRQIFQYSYDFPEGIDADQFQSSFKLQQSTVAFVKAVEGLYFWRKGTYRITLNFHKNGKKPKQWRYEFDISEGDRESMRSNSMSIATIYPTTHKITPYFYSAELELKEVTE